jgi:hypothetical protein
MRTTHKLALGSAAALLLFALAWLALGRAPAPVEPADRAPEIVRTAPAIGGSGVEASQPADTKRVALPDALRDTDALAHPYVFELEVQVVDRLGLPVEGAGVLLAPLGCRLDEAPERTDGSGIARIQWRGRAASMPIVVATRADETRGAMRQIVVRSGSPARVVFGGSSGQGIALRVVGDVNVNGQPFELALEGPQAALATRLVLVLDTIVQQQGAFPSMRAGLHPFASFADLQWRERSEAPAGITVSGHGQGSRIGAFRALIAAGGGEDAQPSARIEGHVYGEDGRPCAGCPVVWGEQVDRPSQRAETDERGAFRFEGVAAGALELRAGGGDGGLRRVSISTRRDQTTAIDLHLQREATVRGRAVDAAGKPLAGWRVEWAGTQVPWFDACTVAGDGSFVLPNLPGGAGQLLLSRGDGSDKLPVLQVSGVLPDSGPVELRFDAGSSNGTLQIEPALPDGLERGAVEVRVFQDDTGRGTSLRKAKDGNQFTLGGLAAGWYRLELGGPGFGWLDAGRHWVDGRSVVDLGRVRMPRAGALRLHAAAGSDSDGAAVEIYQRRADCDVRIDDPASRTDEPLPLPASEYFALWRAATGELRCTAFAVEAGCEVEVRCVDPVGERR